MAHLGAQRPGRAVSQPNPIQRPSRIQYCRSRGAYTKRVAAAAAMKLPWETPPDIYGIGMNYASHAKELGRDPPSSPLVFTKSTSSFCTGPYIVLPGTVATPPLHFPPFIPQMLAYSLLRMNPAPTQAVRAIARMHEAPVIVETHLVARAPLAMPHYRVWSDGLGPERQAQVVHRGDVCCVAHTDPAVEGKVDFEAELAVVIGPKPCWEATEADAMDYVLGYAIANDVSGRFSQFEAPNGGQWSVSKGFDTFCSVQGEITPASDIGDPHKLAIKTILNGEIVQEGSTSDMIFRIPQLISFLSKRTTLLPGTLILTGTPPGPGHFQSPPQYLKPGDVLTMEITGLGALTQEVIANDDLRHSKL